MPLFPDPCHGIVALRLRGMPGHALDSGLIPEDEIAGRSTAQRPDWARLSGWNHRGDLFQPGGLLARPASATPENLVCDGTWISLSSSLKHVPSWRRRYDNAWHRDLWTRHATNKRRCSLTSPESLRPIFGFYSDTIFQAIRHYAVAGFHLGELQSQARFDKRHGWIGTLARTCCQWLVGARFGLPATCILATRT